MGEMRVNTEEDELLDEEPKVADLSGTVGAFALIMQKKKREQTEKLDTAGQESKTRQQNLLKAMVKIRRSLDEVSRLDLGERFRLILEKDDHHGWPRLTIRLLDAFKPNVDYPFFQVIAHDRQARGAIEIAHAPNVPTEFLSLAKEGDYKKLPVILKKTVRSYLDLVGEVVLAAENGTEDLTELTELEGTEELLGSNPASAPTVKMAAQEDFFDSGYTDDSGFEKLPELSSVQALRLDLD